MGSVLRTRVEGRCAEVGSLSRVMSHQETGLIQPAKETTGGRKSVLSVRNSGSKQIPFGS